MYFYLQLINIYFPTVPRSGNTHTRKLWEAVTSIGSESVYRETSNKDRRSGAYVRRFGGIGVSSRGGGGGGGGSGGSGGSRPIRAGRGKDPILVKSHDKSYFKMFYLTKSSHILLLVRNPVDNYVSDLIERNVLYKLKNINTAIDIKRTQLTNNVSFKRWVMEVWMRYQHLWFRYPLKRHPCVHEERGRGVYKLCKRPDLPRIVLRYEDLFMNPSETIDYFLNATGVKSQLRLSSEYIVNRILEVEEAAKIRRPPSPINSKDSFDFVSGTKKEARRILELMKQKQLAKALECFGYVFTERNRTSVTQQSYSISK